MSRFQRLPSDHERAAVVIEAQTWLHTRWHHLARVKGVGVDCAQFLVAVYAACGIVPDIDTGYYPPDWHLHRSSERYLDRLLEHAVPVAVPQAGDIAGFRYGRPAISHAGIVIEWPMIIHAYRDEGMVTISDASKGSLAMRLNGFFSPWGSA
jgi:cell wall-associated NlpC family hydrolase